MDLLLVEDDATLRRSLARGLGEQGYAVRACASLAQARSAWTGHPADLVLLDLGLPDGDGIEWLREVRADAPSVPVIILTARDALDDRVRGLDSGADDYLVKPFAFPELLARIRARQRRAEPAAALVLRVGDLELDVMQRRVKRGGAAIECTPREFDLLLHLARHAGQPVSRARLAEDVWKIKSRMTSMDNVIDVQLSRLREKVDRDAPVRLIHTVRGLGYMLKEPS